MSKKKLLIDAIFIGSGGAINHLVNLLLHYDNKSFESITVIGTAKLLNHIPSHIKIRKESNFFINNGRLLKFIWSILFMKKYLKKNNIDLLFGLNGINFCNYDKFVGLSQNLLPFNKSEYSKLIFSPLFVLKLILIRKFQIRSYDNSVGFIFLTKYALEIFKKYSQKKINTLIVPHGINKSYFATKTDYNFLGNIKLLSISPIEQYKNFDKLIPVLTEFNKNNKNKIFLTIYGSFETGIRSLKNEIKKNKFDQYITLKGSVDSLFIAKNIHNFDIFIFPSTCENFPITLLEASAAKIPILCSDVKPMNEILKNSAFFFDPYSRKSIINALNNSMDIVKRQNISKNAFKLLNRYNWKDVSSLTFSFINKI